MSSETAYFQTEHRKRKDDEPMTIFAKSGVGKEKMRIHCMFCGLPVFATRNKMIYVVDNESNTYVNGKKSSNEQMCKRCGQRWQLVV